MNRSPDMTTQPARGQAGRPTTDSVLDPQAARAEVVRRIFREQHKFLAALFPKDGAMFVARSLSSALQALKTRDKKGKLTLEEVPAELVAEKCIACHHMGLEPGTEAYLVPYGKDVTIITAPKGLIKLMYNAGWIVESRAVREGDFFEHEMGDAGFIKHRKVNGRREGAVTFGYAFARHRDGGPTIREVLSRDDIDSFRAQSKQANGPMWNDNYEGAVRKTGLHRIAEYIPLPSAVMAAFRTSEETGGVEISEEIMDLLRAARASTNGKPEAPPAFIGGAASAGEAEYQQPASDDGRQEAGA